MQDVNFNHIQSFDWQTCCYKSLHVVLRELHSYFLGAEKPYLSKSVTQWVSEWAMDRQHPTKFLLCSIYQGKMPSTDPITSVTASYWPPSTNQQTWKKVPQTILASPYTPWQRGNKSAPNYPGKPLRPLPPLRAIPLWKQNISKSDSLIIDD